MKKTLKAIISAALVLTFLFCSFVPAFASETGETMEWCYHLYEYADLYCYGGTVTEGENELVLSSKNNAFLADFDRPGFYLFSFEEELISSVIVSRTVHDGVPCDEANVLEAEEGGRVIAYIPDEETYIGFEAKSELSIVQVDISYYDYEIEDIVFENSDLENLIYSADFRFSEDKSKITIRSNIEVLFENGEKYFAEFGRLDFDVNSEIVYGENTVSFAFGDYSEDVVITVCYPMNYIQKIEITNIEKYLHSVRYYDGSLGSAFEDGALKNETLTVTYTDGTVTTIQSPEDFNMIELPNGRHYEMWITEVDNGDSAEFAVEVAGQILYSRDCELKTAGVVENIGYLCKNISFRMRLIAGRIDSFLYNLTSPYCEKTASKVAGMISGLRNEIESQTGYIKEEICTFCEYYGF